MSFEPTPRQFGPLLLIALLALALAALGCAEDDADASGPQTTMTENGSFEVTWTSNPDPIPRNEYFTMDVTVRSMDGADMGSAVLVVDAFMPLHGHGMNTQPSVTNNGDGTFHVEGMLFHMPGEWDLSADVQANGKVERALFTIMLD